MELGNRQYASFLAAIYAHYGLSGNPSEHLTFVNNLSKELDHLTLDLMPIFCGDLDLEHNSETMLARGRKMPDDLISSQVDAPIIREPAWIAFRLIFFI